KGIYYGIQSLRQILQQASILPCMEVIDWPDLSFRGTHITLGSGHMPTFEKLKEILEFLSRLKQNVLVLEYDDRFPFERHPVIPHLGALTKIQIAELVKLAKTLHIQIIPLLDSLGHAQAYLRHPEYKHLAELPRSDAEMCPSNPETLKFVKELWAEVLELHKDAEYAHISGDEVFRLGDFCPQCKKMAQAGKLSELYCDYYRNLSQWIIDRGIRPLMWSDMVTLHPEKISSLPKQIIFNDWNYRRMEKDAWENTTLYCHRYVDKKNINKVPESLRLRYERYWLHDSTAPEFTPFPYIRYLQDEGFDVIGSPSASCETSYKLPVPHFKTSISNALYYSKALRNTNALGILNTFWSDHRSVFGAIHGIAAGAAYGWHVKEQSETEFLQHLECVLCGSNADFIVQAAQLNDSVSIADTGFVVEKHTSSALIPEIPLKLDSITKDYMDILQVNSSLAALYREFSKICFEIDSILFGTGVNKIIDISAAMNIRQDEAIPLPGANLCGLKPGIQRPFNVPFLIGDDKDDNCSLIGTYGKIAPLRAKAVTIGINAKCSKIFFLHTTADAELGKPVAYYRIHFSDGA
ncbi:MAG: family 20 glycosylhydrolase, partial [Lentisphaerae bacterium]|nr:family 20 glycosylhydrolase [Lentisphaerota bacterium]